MRWVFPKDATITDEEDCLGQKQFVEQNIWLNLGLGYQSYLKLD